VGGNYVDALTSEDYAVAAAGKTVAKWRVRDNLLGGPSWCPTVRRSAALDQALAVPFVENIRQLTNRYPPELLRRAAAYLYSKETRSTYAIEHEDIPPADRRERFVQALSTAGQGTASEQLGEAALVDLQRLILDERYAAATFRTVQNYVGESRLTREIVHYACPPPELVRPMMDGLARAAERMRGCNAVLTSAVTSFGFVFIHPFEDGNGRTHRFLIHDALLRGGVVPKGVIVPVSATMERNKAAYDDALEQYSRPMQQQVTYSLDDRGKLTMLNPGLMSASYRFPDLTAQVIYLARTLDTCIREEFADELKFLSSFDAARVGVRDIVDVPDRRLDLFIKLVWQNKGRLGANKRDLFAELTAEEIGRMEGAVRAAFNLAA